MKNRIVGSLLTLVVLLAWGPIAYAGCTNNQFAGTWGIAFSDGNACRLVLNKDGEVLSNPDRSQSTCFDPFRGTTADVLGIYDVSDDCSVSIELLVEGYPITMGGLIAQPHNVVGGIFVVVYSADPLYAEKGSITMIRK